MPPQNLCTQLESHQKKIMNKKRLIELKVAEMQVAYYEQVLPMVGYLKSVRRNRCLVF